MKLKPLVREAWNKGWTHERILLAMQRAGWKLYAFSFHFTWLRKGDLEVVVPWANYINKAWPSVMWTQFSKENNLCVSKREEDGLSLITERQSNGSRTA